MCQKRWDGGEVVPKVLIFESLLSSYLFNTTQKEKKDHRSRCIKIIYLLLNTTHKLVHSKFIKNEVWSICLDTCFDLKVPTKKLKKVSHR